MVPQDATRPSALSTWHHIVAQRDARALAGLLADDVVFVSPVVHTPQHGKAITQAYLSAAVQVFGQPGFRYLREVVQGSTGVLEFEVVIDGIAVNGVDIISWNADGKITEFKVMVRPLKGMQVIHQKMGELLAAMAAKAQPNGAAPS